MRTFSLSLAPTVIVPPSVIESVSATAVGVSLVPLTVIVIFAVVVAPCSSESV